MAFNQLVGGSIPPRPTSFGRRRRSRMTGHRIVIAQFCDDVRQEIGNKFSLMGCYGTDLYVPSFPFTLPWLCACVPVRRPRELPLQRLTLRLVRGGEVLSELVANPY